MPQIAEKGQVDPVPPILALSEVAFSWEGTAGFALAVEDFIVLAGERVLITGPSGCGKSTLLGLICGILHPRSGVIEVQGRDIAPLRGAAADRFRADHFGIIFQMFNLLPYGTALENVLLPLSFAPGRRERAGVNGQPASEASRLLSSLGLAEELWQRRAARLSVGQQQRVAAARALIGAPAIIIADEPTSALDRGRQEEFLALLFQEAGRAGSSVVMVSHDETLAPQFDRVLAFDAIAGRA